MKIVTNATMFLAIYLLTIGQVWAGNVKVIWHEPTKFSDVKGAEESDKRFQKRVFKQMEKHIIKLATPLAEHITIELKVTDFNLAGDVRYNFNMNREIRLVKSMYWPKISFDYKVLNKTDLIDSGSVVLKDMAFMQRGGLLRNSSDSFKYEKRLLTEWFDKTLQQKIDNYQKQQSAIMSH